MLVPKRVKHRREFRGKMRGEAKGGKEGSIRYHTVYKQQESHWDYKPSNRSSTYRYDTLHETWWESMD